MNTNEENKTEDRESGIQTYDRKRSLTAIFLKSAVRHAVLSP